MNECRKSIPTLELLQESPISTTKICGEYLQKPYNYYIKLSIISKKKYLHSTSYLERQRYFCERMIKATQSTKRLFCIFDNVRDI